MTSYKVSLSDRGQVVIPAAIRRKFSSKEFVISFDDGKIVMLPSRVDNRSQALVEKLDKMNKQYEKSSKEKISVLDEIRKEGA